MGPSHPHTYQNLICVREGIAWLSEKYNKGKSGLLIPGTGGITLTVVWSSSPTISVRATKALNGGIPFGLMTTTSASRVDRRAVLLVRHALKISWE